MLPDRVSNPGPLTYESGVLPIALRGPAATLEFVLKILVLHILTETWHLGSPTSPNMGSLGAQKG